MPDCRYDAHAWECTSCGHQLLTARHLDLHVQEVHDSFFQAQAARSMKVKLSGLARDDTIMRHRLQNHSLTILQFDLAYACHAAHSL